MKDLAFGTKEWASKNVNFVDGCLNDCKYCYSKEMAIRFGRKTPTNWSDENIRIKDLYKSFQKYNGMVMFPSSHDITPSILTEAIAVLYKLLKPGNKVLIVSKPRLECIKRICETFENKKQNILFRFTIGSNNNEVLSFWEPGAPLFEERLQCLRFAYKNGFQTSISCEPMLDFNTSELVGELYPYITETIWIGKANALMKRVRTNGHTDIKTIKAVNKLVNWQSSEENIMDIYNSLSVLPKVRWKESIQKVVNEVYSEVNN